MKKNKIVISIIIVFILAIVLIMNSYLKKVKTVINLTEEEKIRDFEYLYDTLNSSYPFWNEVSDSGIDKNDIYKKYKKEIEKSSTDIEFMKTIDYFLREFKGYGHLSVFDGYMYNYFDDIFTLSKNQLTSDEVKKLNPWQDVLYNPTSIKTYSLLDSSHEGFRSKKYLKEEYKESNPTLQTKEKNKENIEFNIIDKDKIAYLKINSFRFENIEADRLKLQNFLKDIKNYTNLIIDIRTNNGGSDKYWQELIVEPILSEPKTSKRYYLIRESDITTPFLNARFNKNNISSIENLPKFDRLNKNNLSLFTDYIIDEKTIYPSQDSQEFKGKIWVLTSPKVYSSSENFVMFCKNTDFATLVGTPTGGDGGVADPILFSLPNSGLIVRFSMFYGLNSDGTGNEANGTIPDILIDQNENALDKSLSEISK